MSAITKKKIIRRLSLGFFLGPTITLLPFIFAAIFSPAFVVEMLDFYALFFGIPYSISFLLWLYARKVEAQ